MPSFLQSATNCCPIVVVGTTTIVVEPGKKKVDFWHFMRPSFYCLIHFNKRDLMMEADVNDHMVVI